MHRDKSPILEEAYSLYKRRINFTTDSQSLNNMGAYNSVQIEHPHILDLLNESHKHDIHEMFTFMAKNATNAIM